MNCFHHSLRPVWIVSLLMGIFSIWVSFGFQEWPFVATSDDGTGAFHLRQPRPTLDFNCDNRPDFIYGDYSDGTYSIWVNLGESTPGVVLQTQTGVVSPDLYAFDIDSDLDFDLVLMSKEFSRPIAVWFGDGNGGFAQDVNSGHLCFQRGNTSPPLICPGELSPESSSSSLNCEGQPCRYSLPEWTTATFTGSGPVDSRLPLPPSGDTLSRAPPCLPVG